MDYWLPLIFVSLMGLSLLLYIILDGYDLGIGILLPLASDDEKDRMIETIGPFLGRERDLDRARYRHSAHRVS